MNIGYNKKGLYFGTMTIIIIMVVLVGYSIDKYVKEKDVALDKIGVGAAASINSFYEGERIKYFIRESAKFSVLKALTLMGENGGIYNKECIPEEGYVILNEKCQLNNLNENFKKYFDDVFNDYLKDLDLGANDFNIEIEDSLIVRGNSKDKIRIDIEGGDFEIEIVDIKVDEKNIEITLNNLQPYDEFIDKYSEKYNVPKKIVLAVITQESRGKANAVSVAGCHGLMQICPRPHPEYFDETNKNFKCNAMETECNIEAGTEILRRYYNQYNEGKRYRCEEEFCDEKGNCQSPVDNTYYGWEAALRAYNGWGCTGYPDYTYVEKVMKWYELLGGVEIERVRERIGSYYVDSSFFVELDYDLGDYDKLKKIAEACLINPDYCSGNDKYELKNYNRNEGIFEFESKEDLFNIKPVIIKFGLPVEI